MEKFETYDYAKLTHADINRLVAKGREERAIAMRKSASSITAALRFIFSRPFQNDNSNCTTSAPTHA